MRYLRSVPAILLFILVCALSVSGASPQQLNTANAFDEVWNVRTSATSQGKVLWTRKDAGGFLPDVFFYDGTSVSTAQSGGALQSVTDSVFALGSGSSPGDVIGAWRRGDATAWIWTRLANGTASITDLKYTNPHTAGQPMNPEAVAIADGCVFMALQFAVGGSQKRWVFKVNPADGSSANLTGATPIPGPGRITTSGCKAAWVSDDGTTNRLLFYNGSTVTEIDAGALGTSPVVGQGKIVYAKKVRNPANLPV